MTAPIRSPVPRRKTDGVVTYAWLQKQALMWLGSIFLLTVGAAWTISAQVSDLRRDVQEAKDAIPRIEQQLDALIAAQRQSNKTQDSLLAVFTDRERRPTPTNPLVAR